MIDFDQFRHPDGTIDLYRVWQDTADDNLIYLPGQRMQAVQFFRWIETYQPIRSRQVAALALATCQAIIYRE